MATDDERREVASECRERAYREEFSGEAVARAIGTFTSGTTRYDHDAWYRLAVLIDPDCDEGRYEGVHTARPVDRGALLALADELEEETGSVCGVCMGKTARRIREACGVVA